jgi:hypothetical protein
LSEKSIHPFKEIRPATTKYIAIPSSKPNKQIRIEIGNINGKKIFFIIFAINFKFSFNISDYFLPNYNAIQKSRGRLSDLSVDELPIL